MTVSDSILKSLNGYLEDKSYIEGFSPSKSDAVVYEELGREPTSKYPHAARWYRHIAAQNRDAFPGEAKKVESFTFFQTEAEDDDDDLFASDEETKEALKQREAAADQTAKKSKKPPAKSIVQLLFFPWDAGETKPKHVLERLPSIEIDGLKWLTPVDDKGEPTFEVQDRGYGIQLLVRSCLIEDDKVIIDREVNRDYDEEEEPGDYDCNDGDNSLIGIAERKLSDIVKMVVMLNINKA